MLSKIQIVPLFQLSVKILLQIAAVHDLAMITMVCITYLALQEEKLAPHIL